MRTVVFFTALAAFTATVAPAGELPFTAVLMPYDDAGKNMVDFTILNESTEPIVGVLVTRNNGQTFGYVKFEPGEKQGALIEPTELTGAPTANARIGYIWERWTGKTGITDKTDPETFYSSLASSPPNIQQIHPTGYFSDKKNIDNHFAAMSRGFLTVKNAGTYVFRFSVDDGGFVKLTQKNESGSTATTITLLKQIGNKKNIAGTEAVTFKANEVVYIEAFYVENKGSDFLTVEWSSNSGSTWSQIPATSFSPDPPGLGSSWQLDNAVWGFKPLPGSGGGPVSKPSSFIRITDLALIGDKGLKFSGALSELVSAGYAPQLLWNLFSTEAKTTIQVFGEYGNSSTIVLDSTPDNALNMNYTFKTIARPLTLFVKSINENDGKENRRAARFRVSITDPTREPTEPGDINPNPILLDYISETDSNKILASPEFPNLRAGMQVSFEAVSESYFDINKIFAYHSVNEGEVQDKSLGVERFVASGLSVNNSPLTGDPTRYTFELTGNTTIEFRTRQEFALDMEADFSRTRGSLMTPQGEPWVKALDSAASGSPDPAVGIGESVRHWIAAGSQVVAKIDAEVPDMELSAQNLHLRFVPYEYVAKGAARGNAPPGPEVYTNAFEEATLPGVRRQIDFKMDSYASIAYRWKVQFGIYAQSPEPELRKVLRRNGNIWEEVPYTGAVCWFDQGETVRVLAAANRAAADSKALSGWLLGDGWYFPGNGTINTDSGAPDNAPANAEWLHAETVAGKTHRGLQIVNLRRPVTVMWDYGRQIFYDPALKLGEYMLQGRDAKIRLEHPTVYARLQAEPSFFDPFDAAVWDPNANVLYPIKPGLVKVYYENEDPDATIEVHINALWPAKPNYTYIATGVEPPTVELTPDPAGTFHFVETAFREPGVAIAIQGQSKFAAIGNGWALLRFREIKAIGRGEPREYIALRTVRVRPLADTLNENNKNVPLSVIGSAIRDGELDKAGFNTGWLVYNSGDVRFNPLVYDRGNLDGIRSVMLYDMAKLKLLGPQKTLVNPELLPGPVIPVNENRPQALDSQKITIVWYDSPVNNDGLLWPWAARTYTPRWPTGPAEGMNRIVIASEWGSESLAPGGFDQIVTSEYDDGFDTEITFNPTRFADVRVYTQNTVGEPGYNPNEEHALLAPSKRYADVSPRPMAAYALRVGDLNNYGGVKTSEPRVLVQFYDNFLKEYAMRVYSIEKEDKGVAGHWFANQSYLATNTTGMSPASTAALLLEPHKKMEAGEPVIPFYPIGVVEGALPCPESTGENLRGQETFWKDHKHTRWSVSGGDDALFSVKAFYPLQGDFWWPQPLTGATLLDGKIVQPQIGASVAFLPPNLAADKIKPTRILYKSDWPRIAPVLKAGETLTYSGGEFRADNPTMTVPNKAGTGVETIPTPGLPAVVAFAVGEVVFDMLNPKKTEAKLVTDWTLRVAQVMESRFVRIPFANSSFDPDPKPPFPAILRPENGKSYQHEGKYVFKDLPSSLQRRLRYDPFTERLEMRGVLNDKTIENSTLTASPAAVYALEPNILTDGDVKAIREIYEKFEGTEPFIAAVEELAKITLNPNALTGADFINGKYAVGLQPKIQRDEYGIAQTKMNGNFLENVTDPAVAENARAFGVGLAAIPNGKFLDPNATEYPEISWVTIAENNDPSMGGSPVALHVIKVDRRERYRGSIKIVYSDNVFDENIVLRHTGDFGANGDDVVYEWWYRPDDGALNVLPPYLVDRASAGDWKLFPDLSGKGGLGRNEVLLKGDPNAPETLLADSWWFVRYRHKNDIVNPPNIGTDWYVPQKDGSGKVNFEWAGAGNNDPFNDFDLDGWPDYKAQLSMGWIKRVLDAVNPYEARIRDFTGDSPATGTSMLRQLGPRYEGPVALNPEKNVIENVGLIELYQTILNRASDLSINLSSPVSTPAIANALQLASTRLSDFYMLLGNEAYVDAKDPMIGYGSSIPGVGYGAASPAVHAFQNLTSSLLDEELCLLRGQDDNMARPVYNRLFWNFTKGEGEAAYAMNYNISDINEDGFIDEFDAMILYPQGHGDAWGHYLTALKQQYDLLRHPFFNWVARSEFYNLMNVVMKVDFLDERKFAQVAAQKAKAGAEIVANTYRQHFTEDETAQWRGYTDVNVDRAWGVQEWARRVGQGAYFDWVAANALLPFEHPNEKLQGIQKVDRAENADIRLVAANLRIVQNALDDADSGFNPLGISSRAVPLDIDPQAWVAGSTHFEQIYERAIAALLNAQVAWDKANEAQNRLRAIANNEQEFTNDVFQQDLAFRNQLIEIFGRPYPGTIGSGKFYPDGFVGPDLMYYRYVAANNMTDNFPQPHANIGKLQESAEKILNDALEASKKAQESSFKTKWNAFFGKVGDAVGKTDAIFGKIDEFMNNSYVKYALLGLDALSKMDVEGTIDSAMDKLADFSLSGMFNGLGGSGFLEGLDVKKIIKDIDFKDFDLGKFLKGVDLKGVSLAGVDLGKIDFDKVGGIISDIQKGLKDFNKLPEEEKQAVVLTLAAFYGDENPLSGFGNYSLPVTASAYSFLAPRDWGERPAVGELQLIIAEMLQQEIAVSGDVNKYKQMIDDANRSIKLLEINLDMGNESDESKNVLDKFLGAFNEYSTEFMAKFNAIVAFGNTAKNAYETVEKAATENTPTVGMANSLGGAISAAIKVGAKVVEIGTTVLGETKKVIEELKKLTESMKFQEKEADIARDKENKEKIQKCLEEIAKIEKSLDPEADLRLAIFTKAELLRAIGDRYRSTLSKGTLILDEREAFNKRVAALTQQSRYQDMTFRVERNHALQNYNRLFEIAARYAYLAAKAYDYEMNLAADDPGSPSALFEQISKERLIGTVVAGEPQMGGGLADALYQLKANHGVLKHRLGLTNPQVETGKISLRTENFRIFPSGYENPENLSTVGWDATNNADDNWRQLLENNRVDDLWDVAEFRQLARPFNSSVDTQGNPLAEPGVVLRFSTQIKSGNNVFGNPLAGGDHAYDPSVYATRIRSVGVWFSGYLAEDVLADLSATPRVYLIPTGADVMSIPNAPYMGAYENLDPSKPPPHLRVWNVLDQIIPVPVPGINSKLPMANFVPLLDSLDGRIGQQRRFSSFRAYHDSGTAAVNINELVKDSRLVGRSVWNTGWILIIPGRALNNDPDTGLDRFIENVKDIKLVFETYGFSGN